MPFNCLISVPFLNLVGIYEGFLVQNQSARFSVMFEVHQYIITIARTSKWHHRRSYYQTL